MRFVITNRDTFDSTRLGLELAYALEQAISGENCLAGESLLDGESRQVLRELKDGVDPRTILQEMRDSLAGFIQQRERYLLYR